MRGDGVYNNLVEIYNPKEDTVNLADYLLEERRMVQVGYQRIPTISPYSRIIPPGETFAITRAAADPTVVECKSHL